MGYILRCSFKHQREVRSYQGRLMPDMQVDTDVYVGRCGIRKTAHPRQRCLSLNKSVRDLFVAPSQGYLTPVWALETAMIDEKISSGESSQAILTSLQLDKGLRAYC
jgi:hypothetical protein